MNLDAGNSNAANKDVVLTDDRVLKSLESGAGGRNGFRSKSFKVGSVYTMDYNQATIAIYDFDREKAGGLPKGCFLIAAKKEGDESFVLLRVLKGARLSNAVTNDQVRQQAVESTSNDNPWGEALDHWMRNQVSLHGLECRILGTFKSVDGTNYIYAEDTDNYYAVNELLVWKPDQETLNTIINHRHRKGSITADSERAKIGRTKFAAAEASDAINSDVFLDPTDLLQRRTVYLGMSRSGKSNAMKVTAEQIYRLRSLNSGIRVGQLIFDPNGEYAQDNPQDGKGLHKVHESLGLDRNGEVETYGLFKTPSDQKRTIMKINFFGNQLPSSKINWDAEAIEATLEQMLAGREIVKEAMSELNAHYTKAFRDVDLSVPPLSATDTSTRVRYSRAVLAYQTALAAAGLPHPKWKPTINGLFGKNIIDAMATEKNENTESKAEYAQAAILLKKHSGQNGVGVTWQELEKVFTTLNKFIGDSKGHYGAFETSYITKSSTGENWADPRLKNLLRIFETQNGPRSFQSVREQHDPNSENDFAEKVVDDLRAGKLVIVDQSTGDPTQNIKAAERIMWKIFRAQQDSFRTSSVSDGTETPHVLIYLEEAHNLLPKANAADNLKTVWARSAKEGSKMNIGMVLATQAPSSIMPEILSETDNWILAYLNSENERRVIAGYMDFGDFLEQIGQVSEPGFVRIRTLSLAYTVPMKFGLFRLN